MRTVCGAAKAAVGVLTACMAAAAAAAELAAVSMSKQHAVGSVKRSAVPVAVVAAEAVEAQAEDRAHLAGRVLAFLPTGRPLQPRSQQFKLT